MRFSQLFSILPLAAAVVLPRDNAVNYDGYRVYRIQTNGNHDKAVSQLSALSYEKWTCGHSDHSDHLDISLSKENAEQFEALGLDYKVMHEDLGADILAESAGASVKYVKRQNGALPSDSWFNSYHSYADHVQYWRDLNAAFPKNSEWFVAGQSYEKRNIFGLKLFGNDSSTTKPAVIWHSTVHAREWITTMTVEYVAYNMIKGYQANQTDFAAILNRFDVYILPVVNPDGFSFTQTNDRLWRKNRSPAPVLGSAKLCYGTDINRNWPYQWTGDPRGASVNPCDQTYKGRAAGDTPENKALVAHMTAVSKKQPLAQYIDWHSYGQYALSPYGYTANVPANSAQQVDLGNKAAAAIAKVHGTQFTVGPSGATLYPTTGSSADFATDIAKAKYAFAFELRDKGENGFVLPPAQIKPTGEEMLEGVKVMFLQM